LLKIVCKSSYQFGPMSRPPHLSCLNELNKFVLSWAVTILPDLTSGSSIRKCALPAEKVNSLVI
jgi:hypothetical protein